MLKTNGAVGLRRLMVVLAGLGIAQAKAADWANWRGPTQNGVSYETGLPASCKDVLWRAPYGGRSTPVIVNGRVFGIDLAGEGVMEQERVFAVDLATGKLVWEHRQNVFHTDVPDTRVGWASLVADPETGYVYANGVGGMFLCFDRDGRQIWSRSLTELYGRISGFGGRTHTPIIDEDRVVISFLNSSFGAHAVGAHRYLAMNKRTGEIVWWAAPGGKPEDTTYSTPVTAVVDGQRLLIGANADGAVYAMNARTGEKVWGFRLSQRGINSNVVVDGYRVYAAHCDENWDSIAMGRVVAIDARGAGDITKTHELWRCDGLEVGYSSPLVHGGRLYAVTNSGVLVCLDANTGTEIWRQPVGRVGKGSPVWADGKIYVTTAEGRLTILEDGGNRARQIDKVAFGTESHGPAEAFGSPAVSDGRVVLFNSREMVCLGTKDAKRQEVKLPASPAESPADSHSPLAHLQVRPAEVLLRPGQAVHFAAAALDKLGRPLDPARVEWSFTGPGGKVEADGTFRASERHAGSIGELTARHRRRAGLGAGANRTGVAHCRGL